VCDLFVIAKFLVCLLMRCMTLWHCCIVTLSRTTRVSRHQKDKTNLDFTEARYSEWQWRQLRYMQVCTSLQTDNGVNTTPLLSFFTGRMPFLPPNQQHQSTEGKLFCQDSRQIDIINSCVDCISNSFNKFIINFL